MDLEQLTYTKRDRGAWIRLSRPKMLNALTPELLHSLKRATESAREDPEVAVLVITGAGRGFCAGADINFMLDADLQKFRAFLVLVGDVLTSIRNFPKPTIAAINGPAAGGGFELALQCDFRIAARSARLGSGEVNINQPMTNASTYLLPRLIGEGRAKELAMTGDLLDAEEAARIGLVNRAVDPASLQGEVEELARKLASRGPLAVRLVKKCFARSRDVDVDTAVMSEAEAATRCFLSEDQQEGFRAFLEKRQPDWSGR